MRGRLNPMSGPGYHAQASNPWLQVTGSSEETEHGKGGNNRECRRKNPLAQALGHAPEKVIGALARPILAGCIVGSETGSHAVDGDGVHVFHNGIRRIDER